MINFVNETHLKEILEIEYCSFSKPWTESSFRKDINNKIAINWVYLYNDKVVGYMFGLHILDEYHLNNIAVKKEFRQKRVASNLLKNMKYYLIDIKVKSVLLEVNASNLCARNLYEKTGFIYRGKRKDYYARGDDAFLMHWNFNDGMV